MKELAEAIDLGISDNSPPPKEIAYFPKSGLKPGSIEYIPDGLLGHQFLKRGFKGTYIQKDGTKARLETEVGDQESYLIIAIFDDSREAVNALKLYRDNLTQNGETVGVDTQFGSNTLTGKDRYQGRVIIAQKGPYLIGAIGFEKESDAENRLAEFIKNVD